MDFSISRKSLPVRCPLCGSRKTCQRFAALIRCRECGIQFFAGYQNLPKSTDLYGQYYFHGGIYRNYLGEANRRLRRFRDKMELMRTVLPSGGRLLDVGCASGFFLRVAKESGFEGQGVEISTIPLDYARKVMGVEVFHGNLFDARFPDANFDVVTLWDTLEHLRDPQKVLTEIRRILKSGGVLVVETLNMNTLCCLLLRGRWPLYAPPYHLFYFTRKTLKKLFFSTGYQLRRQFPIQTYFPGRHGPRCIRYFRVPFLRSLLGWILGDVILYVAVKP